MYLRTNSLFSFTGLIGDETHDFPSIIARPGLYEYTGIRLVTRDA
ncbi:MAG: hypothetical protein R6U55_08550 [Desulfovermiculus sp.]